MTGKFEINSRSNGDFQFSLKAGHGQVVLGGQVIGQSEMYSSADARDGGIRSVVENAPAPRWSTAPRLESV